MQAKTNKTSRFFGLNNVTDPLRLKFGWLQRADNVDVTNTGAIVRRDGYQKVYTGNVTGAYNTKAYERLYIVSDGVLRQVNLDNTVVDLMTGLSPRPVHWTEINDDVYFTNGVDNGVISKDGTVRGWSWPDPALVTLDRVGGNLPAGVYQVVCTFTFPDGRETGTGDASAVYLDGTQALAINNIPQAAGFKTQVYIAPADSTVFQLAFRDFGATSATWNNSPDALGIDLITQFLDPLPRGCEYITAWRGQIYASMYMPQSDQTVIWQTAPLIFHLFDLNSGFILVPGHVTMLAPQEDGLIVGTDNRIYVYDGEKMDRVADYGVVPGWGWVEDDDEKIMFWSRRGLCMALPFSNVTLEQISVDCGQSAGAAILRSNGTRKYVVALQRGGENFNERGSK